MKHITAFILAACLTGLAAAGTQPVPMVTTVVQPKGPVRAWQLVFDNAYSNYTSPSSIGFYANLASCERVKSQLWPTMSDGNVRHKYHRLVCVEVDLP